MHFRLQQKFILMIVSLQLQFAHELITFRTIVVPNESGSPWEMVA